VRRSPGGRNSAKDKKVTLGTASGSSERPIWLQHAESVPGHEALSARPQEHSKMMICHGTIFGFCALMVAIYLANTAQSQHSPGKLHRGPPPRGTLNFTGWISNSLKQRHTGPSPQDRGSEGSMNDHCLES
jgi:hypothetical protein